MSDNQETGGAAQAIDVLLHEYDALRAEILARASSRFQLTGFAAVVATLLGVQKSILPTIAIWVIIGVLAVGAIAIWLIFRSYINKCAARVWQIEEEINAEMGEPLLIWESHRLSSPRPLEAKSAIRNRWRDKLMDASNNPGSSDLQLARKQRLAREQREE